MRIVTIVGARPQFIKAAALSRALHGHHEELLVHTGQHYDKNMSDVFFAELGIPAPYKNLGVGSGSHGAQTAVMLQGIEETLIEVKPDLLITFGDTNSTLAGALAAAKLHIPIAHVEAGLRSFNRRMPEEINRVLTDHLSDLLFTPTDGASRNLASEGITRGVTTVGDIMIDVCARTLSTVDEVAVLREAGVRASEYVLATIHRAESTDDPTLLKWILSEFGEIPNPVLFLVHPRTRKVLQDASMVVPDNVLLREPVGYASMVALTKNARVVCTDSGGLQKEAYFLGTPCVTLRTETEWVETVELGWNAVLPPGSAKLKPSISRVESARQTPRPAVYGAGDAAIKIRDAISTFGSG